MKVVISVQGGMVAVEEIPVDLNLEVRDYDVGAYDEDDGRLQYDSEGRPYVLKVVVGQMLDKV